MGKKKDINGTGNVVKKHYSLHPPESWWRKTIKPIPKPIRRICGRHWGKFMMLLLVVWGLAYGYMRITAEPEPEYITAKVKRGDIVQTVEAVGTVTSERDLNLQFPMSGVVAEVLVREGDEVEAGQRLASLRANELLANINSESANLQAAQADLRELQEGTRPEDIAIAEAEVANKHAALEAVRENLKASESQLKVLEQEAQVALIGEIATAKSTASQKLTVASNALGVVDDVLDDRDVQDALIHNYSAEEAIIRAKRGMVYSDIQALISGMSDVDNADSARAHLDQARGILTRAYDIADSVFNLLVKLPPSSSFTRSEREARKNDVAAERKNIQDGLNAIDNAKKSLQDASANFDTKIAAEKSAITSAKADILTYEASLRTQEAQLSLKRAGARQTEIDAAEARVRQAKARLDRVRADYENTILKAPVPGTITKVNVKAGELLSTAFQQDAAITMLGESPYRIEMFVSEIDIPKVSLGQKASVELDAFPDKPLRLDVAEIDPAATIKDGVPKYRVKLDFYDPIDSLKIGMTGDVDIVTGGSKNVLMVPARAVIVGGSGSDMVRVIAEDGTIEKRKVRTGIEGGMDMEVREGLKAGEDVVVILKK